jgi:hypothetical protein
VGAEGQQHGHQFPTSAPQLGTTAAEYCTVLIQVVSSYCKVRPQCNSTTVPGGTRQHQTASQYRKHPSVFGRGCPVRYSGSQPGCMQGDLQGAFDAVLPPKVPTLALTPLLLLLLLQAPHPQPCLPEPFHQPCTPPPDPCHPQEPPQAPQASTDAKAPRLLPRSRVLQSPPAWTDAAQHPRCTAPHGASSTRGAAPLSARSCTTTQPREPSSSTATAFEAGSTQQ